MPIFLGMDYSGLRGEPAGFVKVFYSLLENLAGSFSGGTRTHHYIKFQFFFNK